jgi:hypothetical protein
VIQDFLNLKKSLELKLITRKSIVYLINTHRFIYLFSNATENAQREVLILIKEEKHKAIKDWLKRETGDHSLTELRNLGRKYSITNYGRLSKRELITALEIYV